MCAVSGCEERGTIAIKYRTENYKICKKCAKELTERVAEFISNGSTVSELVTAAAVLHTLESPA